MKRIVTKTLAAALLLGSAGISQAEISGDVVKIGVLTDMSSVFSDVTGAGSVEAAKMAIEKLGGKIAGKPIELVFADHQNKADIGAGVARRWFDAEGVDVIVDLPNSAVALAVNEIARERGKAILISGAASSDLTGSKCSPTTVQWTYDTWALANSTAKAVVAEGGKRWYFLTADYAFGHAMQRDAGALVEANGGKVIGSVRHPLNTNDFSSFLIQAQSSRAEIIGLANAGADTANSIKQAAEFGITRGGQKLVGLLITIPDIHAVGLKAAQGLMFTGAFYWNRNAETRKFSEALAKRNRGVHPDMIQAGVYASILHYAKAVEKTNSDDGKTVVDAMKAMPTDDPLFGKGSIRADGRKLHPIYLFKVKSPEESKEPWDYYNVVQTIEPDAAFRPVAAGSCPLVK